MLLAYWWTGCGQDLVLTAVSSYLDSHHHGAVSALSPLHCGSRYYDVLRPTACISKSNNNTSRCFLRFSYSKLLFPLLMVSCFNIPASAEQFATPFDSVITGKGDLQVHWKQRWHLCILHIYRFIFCHIWEKGKLCMKHALYTAETDIKTSFFKGQCHTVTTDHQILAI